MTTLTEGELVFNFPSAWVVEIFDADGRQWPKDTKPVDFIAETPDRLLLIEVKDPSASKTPTCERQKYIKTMQTNELTHEVLVPKARTSWAYLHLMARTTKPILYVVVLGAESLSVQPPLWMNLRDKLKRRLAQEVELPWVNKYVEDCMVVPALELGKFLEGVTVTRVPREP